MCSALFCGVKGHCCLFRDTVGTQLCDFSGRFSFFIFFLSRIIFQSFSYFTLAPINYTLCQIILPLIDIYLFRFNPFVFIFILYFIPMVTGDVRLV